jgi:hypothetical protein
MPPGWIGRDMGADLVDHQSSSFAGPFGVGPGVEARRGEVLGAVESQLSVPTQVTGHGSQGIQMLVKRCRKTMALGQKDVGDVMDARRLDAVATEKALQGQLHHLLRLPHHIGPTLVLEQDIQSSETDLGATDVVGGEIEIVHPQAASTQ